MITLQAEPDMGLNCYSRLRKQIQYDSIQLSWQIAEWKAKPHLIICSPMTRAIQTAAIVFAEDPWRILKSS